MSVILLNTVFLGISFDLGSATLARLDLIPEIGEPTGQCRLVDRCGEVLGIEEALLLESAGRTVLSFRHVEDDGVGVELRRCVAIDRAASLTRELGGNALPFVAVGWPLTRIAPPRCSVLFANVK